MKRLAIVTTHPIQYNAPLFKLLTERGLVQVKVFYTWGESCLNDKYDPGFAKKIEWDIPLLNGYEYEWADNVSKKPGSHHFRGIINRQLLHQIRLYNPDALLVYGWSYHSHLQVLRTFRKKVNILFRGDSHLLDKISGIRSIMRYTVLNWVYKHVDKALFTGKENKKYYQKYGLRNSQLIYAPHAVDNNRFSFTPENKELADIERHFLGISDDEIVFLYAGKFELKKNPELLLRAFQKQRLDNQHLIMVGNGPLERHLKKIAQNGRGIHFMDFQNQSRMPVIYQMCDVFVLPSSGPGETWGLAVNEAMAAGKAVLISDKCGCSSDLVKNGENGYVFMNGSVNDVGKKISMMCDKALIQRFGARSAESIKTFSFENICKAIESSI